MIPQSKKYFILIVHYGNGEPTNTLVKTLLAGDAQPKKLIVVDHAEHPLVLSSIDSRLQLIRPQENAGYGAGINIGLGVLLAEDIAPDDIVVCMNNDVQITSDILFQLAAWWERHPKSALVGVKAGYVNLFTGRTQLVENPKSKIQNPKFLPYIHGAFFSAPYKVLMSLTGLPTHYFLYWEDVLLSQRARQQGIPLRVIEGVDIQHNDELTDNTSEQKLYYLVRNGALFLQQETSWPWRMWWWVINKLRWMYHGGVVRRALRDAAAARTGKMPV